MVEGAPTPARAPSPPAAARPRAPPPRAPPPASPRIGPLRRLGRYLFPRDTDEPRTRSGFATEAPREWIYWLFAVGIGAGLAALWWWTTLSSPVPPGDDPSTWITTSYPYVGLAFPSGVSLLGYPPASFPFIGTAVILGGGPLTGGRIFTTGIFVALGLSTYLMGRTLLRRPSLALLAEGLLIAEPDFQQIFYFGGYPNLFAMVFMTLALSFFVMFLRSRRPEFLILFWTTATVCVLSHSLTAAIMAGSLALLALGLMIVGRLPRTVLLSRAGLTGLGIAVVGVGGYYGATRLLQIGHPVYLASTSAISGVTSVLLPFHFSTLVHLVTGGSIAFDTPTTLEILLLMAGTILTAVFVLRLLEPNWLTTPWLVVSASLLAIFVEILVGAELSIATDYRRFPYFLYTPFIFGLLLAVEAAVDRWWPVRAAAPAAAKGAARPMRRWRLDGARRRWGEPVLLGVGLVVVLVAAEYYTLPASSNYMSYYTLYAHDSAFLSAMNALIASQIPGNIVSTSPYSGHWPSTLSSRLTYVPAPVGSISADFSPPEVLAEEETEVTLANRYFATNSLVGVGIPGISGETFNGTPIYGAFANATYQEILRVPPSSLEFGLANGTIVTPYPAFSPAPPVLPIEGGLGYELIYTGYGATMVETVVTVPGLPVAAVSLNVTSTVAGASLISFVQVRIGIVTGVPSRLVAGAAPGSFTWNVSTKVGGFTAYGNTTPASSLSKVIPFNSTTGVNPAVVFRTNATNQSVGTGSLGVTFTLDTPVASNVLTTLGPWISSDQTWANWSVRFILQFNGTTSLSLITPGYLQAEYGAALYARGGQWTVYLLPQWPAVLPSVG